MMGGHDYRRTRGMRQDMFRGINVVQGATMHLADISKLLDNLALINDNTFNVRKVIG